MAKKPPLIEFDINAENRVVGVARNIVAANAALAAHDAQLASLNEALASAQSAIAALDYDDAMDAWATLKAETLAALHSNDGLNQAWDEKLNDYLRKHPFAETSKVPQSEFPPIQLQRPTAATVAAASEKTGAIISAVESIAAAHRAIKQWRDEREALQQRVDKLAAVLMDNDHDFRAFWSRLTRSLSMVDAFNADEKAREIELLKARSAADAARLKELRGK